MSGCCLVLFRSCAVVLPILLSFLLSATILLAQEPSDEVEVLRVSTDLIVFPIRVAAKNRQLVPALTETDFAFKDDDKVASARYFSAGAERVAVVFALDESGSLREIIANQRETALKLLDHFKTNSRIGVLRFAEKPKLVVPFDRSTDEARQAFNFPAGANRRTAIFDAAIAAAKSFDTLPRDPAERRIVVLFSDGLDNASVSKAAGAILAARERAVSFYVIHLPLFEPRDGRLAVRSPAKGFRDLAEKTGGKYFLAGDARSALSTQQRDLTPVFQAIAEDLKSQYLLGFYVAESARDGRSHRVTISVTKPGLVYSLANSGFERSHHFAVNPTPRNQPTPAP